MHIAEQIAGIHIVAYNHCDLMGDFISGKMTNGECNAYFHWLSKAVKSAVDMPEGMLYSYAECTCL